MADKKRKNTPLWEADEDVNDNIKKYHAKDENFEQPKNSAIKEAIKRVFPGMFPEIYREMTISAIKAYTKKNDKK